MLETKVKLKVKDVGLYAGGPYIVILNKKDAASLDLNALDRALLKKGKKELVVIVDISENSIKLGEIGLFKEVLEKTKFKSGSIIELYYKPKPKSLSYIKKKLDGYTLNKKEINDIIRDLVGNEISEVESAYFVSACYERGMTLQESVDLTNAIVENGGKLNLRKKIIVDKHSIGGVPGNRTTMIVVPIVAAAGLIIPKTSSRSITSSAGTADTMEVLAPVNLSIKKIHKIIQKTNGCMVWGGALELASADDMLIKVERPLHLDPEGILLSSIMAKKKAVGSTHVVLDIPCGKGAKVTKKEVLRLKGRFLEIAKKLKIKLKVLITDGSQPIGHGIGPALEARDVIATLQGDGPKDLREKSIMLADTIFGMINSKASAREILESGEAYKKMKEIIKAQGGNPDINIYDIKLGKYKYDYVTKRKGFVKEINNKKIATLARLAGAPIDKSAGIYLYVHNNYKVNKGNKLFTIYSNSKIKLNYAKKFVNGVVIVK